MSEKTISLPIKKYSILQNNDDFLHVGIQLIKEGLNLNKSDFLLEAMNNSKDTFKGKPLLCAFPKDYINGKYKLGDGHNSTEELDGDVLYYSYLDPASERCIGFVPQESNISIENINGENWIVLNAIIWKQYNYELVKELLKKRNKKYKISVEITVIKSYFEENIEYIQNFVGDGITLLAIDDSVKEAIPGANLKIYFQSENFSKFTHALRFALNKNKEGDKIVFNKLSMNELCNAIRIILNDYKYSENDSSWEYNKYLIDDLTDNFIIVHDNEDGKIYRIPYIVDDKNNVILDMINKQEVEIEYISKTYAQKINMSKEFSVDESELGKSSKIEIKNDKESANMKGSWSKPGADFLNKQLKASNHTALIKESYLRSDGNTFDNLSINNVHYPHHEIKGDSLIVHARGCQAALSRGMAQGDLSSSEKAHLKRHYKELGLNMDNFEEFGLSKEEYNYLYPKKEDNMKKFIEDAKKKGYSFIGKKNDNLIFAKEKDFDEKKDKEMEKMSVYEIPYKDIKFEDEIKEEKFEEKDLKMADDSNGDGDDKREFDKLKNEYEALKNNCEEEKKTLEEKKRALEEEKKVMEEEKIKMEEEKKTLEEDKKMSENIKTKFEEDKKSFEDEKMKYEEDKKTMEKEKLIKETEEVIKDRDLGLDEKDIEDLRKMRDDGKFEDVKEFVKEVGYKKEMKRISSKDFSHSLSFGLSIGNKNINISDETDIDKLIKKYK